MRSRSRRFAERAIVHAVELARHREGRRVLIVGAGRGGRSLLRELRETPGERVVGFVDDDPGLRNRRLNGVRVAGSTGAIDDVLERTRPDVVFVTIPNAPAGPARHDRAGLRGARDRLPRRAARGRHRSAREPRSAAALTAPQRTLLDRLLAAYPLVVAYLVLLILYAWQTTRIPSPWIFTDELNWALLARGIAHTGHPQLREHTVSPGSLYAYFQAPAWWAGATAPGYAAAKYLNAVIMTATIFPAYGLARLFLPRAPSYFVAVASATIPSLALTGVLMPESLAYFWAALVAYLLARALLRPSVWSIALAVAAVVISPFVREQLRVIVFAAVVAAAVFAATGSYGRATFAGWTRGDRFRAFVLVVGLVIAADVFLIHHAYEWYVGTHYGHRMFTYGLWAIGALAIGVGVLPIVFALAWALGRPVETQRGSRAARPPRRRCRSASSSTPRSRRRSWRRRSRPASRSGT